MKKVIFLTIIILLIIPIGVFAEGKDNTLIANAKSGVLMEQTTGNIIYEKDKDKKVSVASMTKMVAQIIILEQIEAGRIKWNDIVTVSKNAADMGGSQIFLTEGEKISVEDLMKGISVASGNELAVSIKQSHLLKEKIII